MRLLAERQHGVVTRSQARALAPSRDALRARIRSPGWVEATPLVLTMAGATPSFYRRCMIAVLDAGPGALVSHVTAAYLWELPGFRSSRVHVSRLRGRSGRDVARAELHELRLLPQHHGTTVHGVPVTTVARTLFDLAGAVHPARAERALDNALARNMVGLKALRATTIELLEHGRTGSALMRRLLTDRGAGYIPPASGLEAAFLVLIAGAGIELPHGQVDLGAEVWVGRVDFVWRAARLIVEIDSDRHHTSKLDRESDAQRDDALRAAGFRVLRITEHQLRERPAEVVAVVRAALAAGA